MDHLTPKHQTYANTGPGSDRFMWDLSLLLCGTGFAWIRVVEMMGESGFINELPLLVSALLITEKIPCEVFGFPTLKWVL